MGFPVPANAPQFTVGGTQYAIGGFMNGTPVGNFYQFGLFQSVNGGWNLHTWVVQYTNAGDLLADVKAKGGMAAFIAWLKAQFQALISKTFGAAAPSTSEPTSDDQALAAIQAAMAGWKVTGTPPQVV